MENEDSKLQDIICNGCGSVDFSIDDKGEYATCNRCTRTIQLVHKSLVEHKTDNSEIVNSKLNQAYMYFEENNAEKGNLLFKEVLGLEPECASAWWGRYLYESYVTRYYGYKDTYGNSGPYIKAELISKYLTNAYKAIKFADTEAANNFKKHIEEEEFFIQAVNNGEYDIKTKGKSGCYIATAVYGSYNCSQVFILRKFRDEQLENFVLGRIFIRCYYAVSPHLIILFEKYSFLNRLVRSVLDKIVNRLDICAKR